VIALEPPVATLLPPLPAGDETPPLLVVAALPPVALMPPLPPTFCFEPEVSLPHADAVASAPIESQIK
jgi:hypothetical protein